MQTTLRTQSPLTNEQIMRVAPSVFAEGKHHSRSERYAAIPTIDVIESLRKEGFLPYMVSQSRTRDDDKRGHAKHMIRMRHASHMNGNLILNQEMNEIILINSHDGSSSYQMMPGVFRLVCLNGLVSGQTHDDIRVRHSGNVVDNVIEGAFRVLKDFELIGQQKEAMKSLSLNDGEKTAFARAALQLKYDDIEEGQAAPITERQILSVRRTEDRKPDMWTTFNIVQENIIKGGIRARSASGSLTRTREVKGIDQNVKLNRALWTLAEEMRKLKA